MNVARVNRRIVLIRRPDGIPSPAHFARDDTVLPETGEDGFLVRNLYLSIDPAQRGWISATANYSDPVPIGSVMRSLAVGIVESSRSPHFAVGDHLYGWFGWQDYCAATQQQVLRRINPSDGPLTTALGVLGINGVTAFLALETIGRPTGGETVLVSTAAGAVGSIVGQMARRHGCHVVGLTGSAAKVAQCTGEFGYHSAIDYKRELSRETLTAHCPRGIDVFFDNTSGAIADAVWPLLNVGGRIIQCGTASIACWDPVPLGPRHDRDVLTRRLHHEGFVIFDHVSRFAEVAVTLADLVKAGQLVYHEDIQPGLDSAPRALAAIYRGENTGKKIIQL